MGCDIFQDEDEGVDDYYGKPPQESPISAAAKVVDAFKNAVDKHIAAIGKPEQGTGKNDDKSKADSLDHTIAAANRASSAFKIDPVKPDTPAFLGKHDGFNWHGLPVSPDPPNKKAKLSGPEYKLRAISDMVANKLRANAIISERPIISGPSKKESILDTANRIINGERQDSHGAPEDSFQIIAEYWSTFLNAKFKRQTPGFRFTLDPVDVANLMVLFKQARKLGQKPTRDTYADSVGYEAIAADRLCTWED